MKASCQNPCCESRGQKEVRVSVRRAGDQRRTLCATCEEAYSWGVQHGRMSAEEDEQPRRKTRILVTVELGVVTGIMCNDKGAEVQVLDWDDLRVGQTPDGEPVTDLEAAAKKHTDWAKSHKLVSVY